MLSASYVHTCHCRNIFLNIDNSLRPSDAYVCVSKLANIGSDHGLLPGQRQVITWTDAGIFLIGNLGANLS